MSVLYVFALLQLSLCKSNQNVTSKHGFALRFVFVHIFCVAFSGFLQYFTFHVIQVLIRFFSLSNFCVSLSCMSESSNQQTYLSFIPKYTKIVFSDSKCTKSSCLRRCDIEMFISITFTGVWMYLNLFFFLQMTVIQTMVCQGVFN